MLNSFKGFKGKRVFVTGHTGFKGAWLSEWLIGLGAEVSGYSIDIPTKPSLFEALRLSERLDHRIADINDLQSLSQAVKSFDPEFVFHLAAQPLVRPSYDDPITTFKTNILGTAHLLESLRPLKNLRSAVLVTTDKVYEAGENSAPFLEHDRLGGHDPYSGSKAACEIVIRSYFKSFFEKEKSRLGLGVGRAGNVIGGGDFSVDRLIPDAVRAWQAGMPMTIRSPESVRPWQHVLEPLSGYLIFALKLANDPTRFTGEAFNFGPPDEKGGSVEEVTHALASRWKGFQVKVDREQVGTKKETKILRLNCEKASRDLGWMPRLPLKDALEWTASWYETFRSEPMSIGDYSRAQISRYSEYLE